MEKPERILLRTDSGKSGFQLLLNGTVDMNETVENIAGILYEKLEESGAIPGWKCILSRHDCCDSQNNHKEFQGYERWIHAEDNWDLWWMIQNDKKGEDQSECLVFRFNLDCYEKQKELCWGMRY